jgi:hypothetical protein
MHSNMAAPGVRFARAVAVAVVVALLGELLLVAAARVSGEDPLRTRSWVHWDAYRYIDIARQGYVESAEDPPASNTGWFPGFPGLIAAATRVAGVKPAVAGRAIALAALVALLATLALILPPSGRASAALALLLAGFFPGFVYWHAVFPLSTCVFLSLAAIALGASSRFAAGGACGAVAAFTYPTGFIAAAPLALLALTATGLSRSERVRAIVTGPGLVLAGLLAAGAVFRFSVGRWDAYVRYQQQFGQGLHNPLGVLSEHGLPLVAGGSGPQRLVAAQTLLATALLLLAAAAGLRLRATMRPVDVALLVHAALVWAFVNGAGPNVSIYRQASALVGVVPVLARLRPAVLAALLAASLAVGWGVALLFFRDLVV